MKTKKFGRRSLSLASLFFLLPIVVFVITSLPGLNQLTPFLSLAFALALIVSRFSTRVSFTVKAQLWVGLVLTLVGATGWFFSPFFFALHLAAIGIGFVATPAVATAFIVSLMIVFAFSVGEVNATYDFLTLLSLLTALPIVIALRRSYLVIQQQRRGILILEEEQKGAGVTTLDHILANRVNQVSVLLRQPTTYLKQGLSLIRDGTLNEAEQREIFSRMETAVDELNTLVREFESGATKRTPLSRASAPNKQPPP